jgi:hypothetical protein
MCRSIIIEPYIIIKIIKSSTITSEFEQ